jgi:hypothetical protein
MTLLAIALAIVLAAFLFARSRGREAPAGPADDTTPALDAWLRDALELELAETVLGIRGSTPEERRKLARTLADEPDADVVATLETRVRAVELEFVRYAHETEIETKVHVRYEDGKTGTTTRRFSAADVPPSVRSDFEAKGSTHVFRAWAFPWQRAHAL